MCQHHQAVSYTLFSDSLPYGAGVGFAQLVYNGDINAPLEQTNITACFAAFGRAARHTSALAGIPSLRRAGHTTAFSV